MWTLYLKKYMNTLVDGYKYLDYTEMLRVLAEGSLSRATRRRTNWSANLYFSYNDNYFSVIYETNSFQIKFSVTLKI